MMTFLLCYFGSSILYTLLYYFLLTSDKLFSILLEHGDSDMINLYLPLRNTMLYLPLTNIVLNVLLFPINFILKTSTCIVSLFAKCFVSIVGKQEEKYRLKVDIK